MKELVTLRDMHVVAFRLIIGCIIFILSLSLVSAQDVDSSQYVTDSKIERLVDKYSDKAGDAIVSVGEGISEALSSLADSLEKPAEEVFSWYIKYHIARGLMPIFGLLISIIIVTFGLKLFRKHREFDEHPEYIIGLGTIVIGSTLSLVMVIGIFAEKSLTRLIIPEYYVIQDIINIFKDNGCN